MTTLNLGVSDTPYSDILEAFDVRMKDTQLVGVDKRTARATVNSVQRKEPSGVTWVCCSTQTIPEDLVLPFRKQDWDIGTRVSSWNADTFFTASTDENFNWLVSAARMNELVMYVGDNGLCVTSQKQVDPSLVQRWLEIDRNLADYGRRWARVCTPILDALNEAKRRYNLINNPLEFDGELHVWVDPVDFTNDRPGYYSLTELSEWAKTGHLYTPHKHEPQ